MSPEEARDLIRAAILRRPELRFKSGGPVDLACPYLGFCYIATQAFCQLVPEATPWSSTDRLHFWATWPRAHGEVWDLTAEQFVGPFDYGSGRPTHFKTLSARARLLLQEATG